MAVPPRVLERMRQAATAPPDAFVERHLLGGLPFAFEDTPGRYPAFKQELASKLDVRTQDIRLVGSGKVGFSLNPSHLLSLFGTRSDLDVVVVSARRFDAAWLELLALEDTTRAAAEDDRRRLKKSQENIFYGFFRPDQLPLACSLLREWFPRLAGPFENEVARRHEVKAWLFRSLDFARAYYRAAQNRLQPQITKLLTDRGDL